MPTISRTRLLVLAVLLAGCGGGQPAGAGAVSVELESPDGTLAVTGIRRATVPGDGLEVVRVTVAVDGNVEARCELLHSPDECLAPLRVDPGMHYVVVGIECRVASSLSTTHPNGGPCSFRLVDRIAVGIREDVVLDLGQATRHPEEPERYLRRGGRGPDLNSCTGVLQALAHAPSCSANDLARAADLAERAQDECSRSALRGPAAAVLMTLATRTHFAPDPERCFAPEEIAGRSLPRLLSATWAPAGTWPAGTLGEVGSWGWSRDTLPHRDGTDPAGRLRAIREGLLAAEPRAAVLDDVIAGYRADGDLSAAFQAAERAPFSLDPRTPAGHRAFLLVAGHRTDEEFGAFLARGVEGDAAIHCDHSGLSDSLVRHFVADDELSPAEWRAVTAMVRRTPEGSRIHACDYAFRRSVSSPISQEERLRWLARQDCSDARRPAIRGDLFETHMRDGSQVDEDVRGRLTQEFSECLERFAP